MAEMQMGLMTKADIEEMVMEVFKGELKQ
jgi:hypothetical protein